MKETITLPWPPSLNATYRTFAFISKKTGKPASRPILSKEGRDYISLSQKVLAELRPKGFMDRRIKIEITFYPPDRRRRDLANLDKVLVDCLEKYGVFDNDSQIDRQTFIRGGLCKNGGRVVIRLEEIVAPTFAPCSCPVCKSTNLFNEVKESCKAENDIKVAKKK